MPSFIQSNSRVYVDYKVVDGQGKEHTNRMIIDAASISIDLEQNGSFKISGSSHAVKTEIWDDTSGLTFLEELNPEEPKADPTKPYSEDEIKKLYK